ncbi:hypothetical protein PR048_013861 [Dryococelus australis]|uniref:Uncharacterized protein n=1 Tax=Dryococelus australis TaxID=614101 RepID=A0ABQ9HTD7_9NEOP|nr:hypothetical protein PR048_013861 [Dryococelus australis]
MGTSGVSQSPHCWDSYIYRIWYEVGKDSSYTCRDCLGSSTISIGKRRKVKCLLHSCLHMGMNPSCPQRSASIRRWTRWRASSCKECVRCSRGKQSRTFENSKRGESSITIPNAGLLSQELLFYTPIREMGLTPKFMHHRNGPAVVLKQVSSSLYYLKKKIRGQFWLEILNNERKKPY